jgi:lipoprotein signal peptidase
MNFPVFNIADAALTIGVILMCIYFIITGIKEGKKNGK